MVYSDGQLRLGSRSGIRGEHRSIDRFLRSLAEGRAERAVGVILSGAGSDGSQAIEEIKAAGGLTFAQDNSAEFSSMPRHAIATGAIDFVMPPAGIAAELARVAKHRYVARPDEAEEAETTVLEAVRATSGVDFSQYKRDTLRRRINRRMVLRRVARVEEYAEYITSHTEEAEALHQDILIGVTSFFRDPEAYEALKTTVFPLITDVKDRHQPLRVWSNGCSTGEEAYSIAMAYTEYAEANGRRVPMRIFATDLNAAGIERARTGVYSKGILQDVSPERLRRFFIEVDGRYRICKSIRDMCVFARQNMLADPPFSHLSLVACRNVLIYMDAPLQQRLLPVLHYSLQPNAFLWLGSSETIGSCRELFEAEDAKHKIYRKRVNSKAGVVVPVQRPSPASPPSAPARKRDRGAGIELQREADRIVLSRYAPPGVVLNAELEILQFRGDTREFLSPARGRTSPKLLKMLREGLLAPVRGVVRKALRDQATVREEGIRLRTDAGSYRDLAVVAVPIKPNNATAAALVLLFESPGNTLQSINEELETSKEEIQSSNEELASVNDELQNRNNALAQSNNDLSNLVSSSNVAIVILDRGLRLRRFTPAAGRLLNLGPADVNCPIGDIKLGLTAPDIGRLLIDIIDTVAPRELEVRDQQGRWYSLRLRPYLTLEKKVEGAVMILIDIDAQKRTEVALRESEVRLLAADQQKNEFLAVLAHELRNPLAAIRNAAQITGLPQAATADLEKARTIIDRQSQHMVRMVDDLLDASRITRGTVQLRRRPVGMAALVREVAESSAHQRQSRQQCLSLSLPEREAWANVDPARMLQVLGNLLHNASKFTPRGGSIWVSLEREAPPAPGLLIRVRDNGEGMDQQTLARAFDLFAQGDNSVSRGASGMGIGLALARSIVALHGGSLTAVSEGRDRGSEFLVRLAEVRAPDEDTSSTGAILRPHRILIVDDDVDAAESVHAMLRLAGHAVQICREPLEAVAAAVLDPPEVILLDIAMPGMDGYEVARQLRLQPTLRATLIIGLSGYSGEGHMRRSREAGFDQQLVKPLDLRQLQEALELLSSKT